MFRVVIFFITLFASYFLIFKNIEKAPVLFADSKAKKVDLSRQVIGVIDDIILAERIILKKSDVLLINFWASWCSPCMRELPGLNRLNALYKDKGLLIMAINADYENQEKVIKRIKNELALSLNLIKDQNGKLVEAFKIDGLPVTLIVKNQKVVDTIKGEVDFDSFEFRTKIDQLLKSSQNSFSSKNK